MQNRDKDEVITALRAEVEALRTVLSMMPGNVYWKDLDGSYMGCNKNVADVLKLNSPDEIIGKSDNDLIGTEFAGITRKIDMEVITSRLEHCLEEYGFDVAGSPATYLTRKTPLIDRQGSVIGILGISFDITDRKRIEEKLKIAKQKAEAATKTKSDFLATISHELRTPLTSILGFANLLKQTATAPNQAKEYTQHIIESGSYLLSLINSLLDYNKLQTKKFECVELPLNIKELTETVVNMLQVTANAKHLPLHFEYEPNVIELIQSDSRAIRQILINLIGNAIKFTAQGNVCVRVNCIKETPTHATLAISVSDTGPGLSRAEQRHIFRRFTQLENIYTRNNSLSGTGLGLAIVRKLTKLLGGKITIESTPNQGSTFSLICDFRKTTQTDAPWLPYAAKVKILVVINNLNDEQHLALFANTLHDAVTSDTAIDTLLAEQYNHPYDIVVICQSEHIDTPGLVAHIKERRDLHPPLLIVTSTTDALLPSSTVKHIQLPTSMADTKEFQRQLRYAWEQWIGEHTHPKVHRVKRSYVLLIEDNPLIQIIHKKMLEELDCNVDIADTAKSALDMLENNYDMLFVDLGLPDIAGFDLIQQIRDSGDNLATTPIIVLTGYSEEKERQQCLNAGANEISIKPVSQETLAKVLKKYDIS